ncbi:MAG: PEGA domain-containing protein [Candidatus Altiarchaeota archaeon]|nr:PEGA domain-containing protein [Candidatus Altiarchaeota archaeon]
METKNHKNKGKEINKVVYLLLCVAIVGLIGAGFVNATGTSSAKVISLLKVKDKKPGETAALWAKMDNTGTLNMGSDCRVRFWISRLGFVGETSCSGLKSGESGWYKYNWGILSNAKPGAYICWARVYESGKPISSWSSSKKFNVKSKGKPGAKITRLNLVFGDKICAHITNTGGVFFPSSSKVYITYTQVGGTKQGTLTAKCGDKAYSPYQPVDSFARLPLDTLPPGTYKFTAYVAYTGGDGSLIRISESLTKNIKLSPGDVEMSTDKSGAKVYLDGVYKGETNAMGNYLIKDIQSFGEHTVKATKPGYEDIVKTVNVKAWGKLLTGARFKEAKSSAKVTRLWGVFSKRPGQSTTLQARVKNTGSSNLGSGCRVRFWVSRLGFVGETSCSGLKSGRSGLYKYDWRIPSNAKSGAYIYWARVYESGKPISSWSNPLFFGVL